MDFYRIPIIFEGDLAHIASLHVKDSDVVFIAGNLRSDLNHVNASGGETHLQVTNFRFPSLLEMWLHTISLWLCFALKF